jgi:hypothetical protein
LTVGQEKSGGKHVKTSQQTDEDSSWASVTAALSVGSPVLAADYGPVQVNGTQVAVAGQKTPQLLYAQTLNAPDGQAYKTCQFSKIELKGLLRPFDPTYSLAPYPMQMNGEADGRCTMDPGAGWTPVHAKFEFATSPTNAQPVGTSARVGSDTPCQLDPDSDTYSLNGRVYLQQAGSGYYYSNTLAKLNVRSAVIAGIVPITTVEILSDTVSGTANREIGLSAVSGYFASDIVASHVDIDNLVNTALAPGFASQLFVGRKTFRPSDFTAATLTGAIAEAPFVANGGSLYGVGCYKPVYTDLIFAGTLNNTDKNDSELVNAGAAGVQALDSATADPGEAVADEDLANQVMLALSAIGNLGTVPEGLPALPPIPAYTIRLTYKDMFGRQQTFDTPAVINAPTPVIIPNLSSPDGFVVTVSTGNQSVGLHSTNTGTYGLRIQRASNIVNGITSQLQALENGIVPGVVLPAARCSVLPVDIKVILPLQATVGNVASTEGFSVSVGYQSLSAGASNSPADFALALLRLDNGYALHEESKPCGKADKLNVTGEYGTTPGNVSSSDASHINAIFTMSKAIALMDLSFTRDKKTKQQMVQYRASSQLDSLNIYGVQNKAPFIFVLSNVPENIDFCQQNGNACNVAWRADKQSQQSLSFASYDTNGLAKPVNLYFYNASVDNGAVTAKSVVNLTLSNFALDFKVNVGASVAYDYVQPYLSLATGGLTSLFGGGKGNYPYWIYLDTRGNPFTGYYNQSGNNRYTNVASSGNTSAWDHDLQLRKRWFGVRWYRFGRISCNGFGAQFKGAPPVFENYLVGQFCK